MVTNLSSDFVWPYQVYVFLLETGRVVQIDNGVEPGRRRTQDYLLRVRRGLAALGRVRGRRERREGNFRYCPGETRNDADGQQLGAVTGRPRVPIDSVIVLQERGPQSPDPLASTRSTGTLEYEGTSW